VKSLLDCKFGERIGAKLANWVIEKMRASAALMVIFLLVHPLQVSAAGSELDTVLTNSRQRIEKLDYRLSGRLTRVEGNGQRTNYKFVGKAHWFPDGLRLLWEITGPGSDKTTLLLHLTEAGQLTMQVALPGEKAAHELAFEHWNDPLVGTDFSYEDMVESQFFWKGQELLPKVKFGARDCFVLKSKSGAQQRSHYDSVTTWIDSSIMFPVHVAKTIRATGKQKEFISYGLRHTGGVWSATQVEAKQEGKPGSSMMVVEGGTANANLAAKDFEIGQASAK
jgi:Outer membrane lipoprotein-sorting protein